MKYRKGIIFGIVVVLILGFLLLLGLGMAKQSPAATAKTNTAPDFVLRTFSGDTVQLSQFKGKPVVVNFWASWCPPCRAEAPTLEKVSALYRAKGVQFIGIDIQDSDADARVFIKEFGITYPNGMDVTGRIADEYGVYNIPVTYFINKDGVIVSRWVGAISEATLVSRIEGLLK